MNKMAFNVSSLNKSSIVKNSSWGIIAQVSQSVFLSLFFVIIARKYSTHEFANYIIVTVLYQLVTAFSSLGLSQWFIREFSHAADKNDLQSKFFKIQFFLGVLFYLINVLCAYLIYKDPYIHFLALLLGINIVFDNLVNAIKCVNIANLEQKKTFIILTLESFFKFITGCILFIYPFSITTLTIILIVIRFVSLNLFLTYGSSNIVSLKSLYKYKIYIKDLSNLIIANWPFIIIGGVSIINWRISTIIISKTLTADAIANYEISYKLFSIAQILPVIISTSVFPSLIKLFNSSEIEKFKSLYRKVHLYYLLFGLLSFTFIYSFADYFLPLAFGSGYTGTSMFAKQMFLTILVFPTAFLQANMLIAMKLEKLDMLFNVAVLIINVTLCTIGLYFIKSLMVINYSIFIAFLFFHIFQDIVLYKKKISSFKNIAEFYVISFIVVVSYITFSKVVHPFFTFFIYWIVLMSCLFLRGKLNNKLKRLYFSLYINK